MASTKAAKTASTKQPAADIRRGHLIGYARGSTTDENNEHQIDELIRYGVDRRAIFTDSSSGATMKRPGWQALWREIEPGDTVVVGTLGCLGRDMVEVVMTVDEMQGLGIGLRVLNGSIDTATETGQVVLDIFAALAEFERTLVHERNQRGLDRAPESGILGRPPKLTMEMVDKAIIRIQAGEPAQQVADDLKVHRNTLKRRMEDRRKQIRSENQK